MASANMTISLEDDAYEIFKATRVIHCQAFGCKHNVVNFDRFSKHAECVLKRIYINKAGACEQFEEKVDK